MQLAKLKPPLFFLFILIILAGNKFIITNVIKKSDLDADLAIDRTMSSISTDDRDNLLLATALSFAISGNEHSVENTDKTYNDVDLVGSKKTLSLNNNIIKNIGGILQIATGLNKKTVLTKYFIPLDHSFLFIFSKAKGINKEQLKLQNNAHYNFIPRFSVSNNLTAKRYVSEIYKDTFSAEKTISTIQPVIQNNTNAMTNRLLGYVVSDYTLDTLKIMLMSNGMPIHEQIMLKKNSGSIELAKPDSGIFTPWVKHEFIANSDVLTKTSISYSIMSSLKNLIIFNSACIVVLIIITLGINHITLLNNDIDVDLLTGAVSKRKGMNILKGALGTNSVISVIDVNSFKYINDIYGHLVGDKILILISSIFMKNIRPSDAFIRTGGDEFILLLSKTDLKQAPMKMNQIIEKINQDHQLDGELINASISFGFSELSESIEKSIFIADGEMYRYKKLHYTAINDNGVVIV